MNRPSENKNAPVGGPTIKMITIMLTYDYKPMHLNEAKHPPSK